MEESTRLTDSTLHRRKRMLSQNRPIYVDDESSTDSGCSSRGSSESNDRLSRRGSADRLCETSVVNSHGGYYLHRLRGHQRRSSTSQLQERLSQSTSSANLHNGRSKSSRSWSPSEERGSHSSHHHHHHHHHRHHSRESPSHSSSPSDAQSSDSDSLKRPSKTVIKRALQCLKIVISQENGNHQNNSSDGSVVNGGGGGNINNNLATPKEKNQTKKSPRRILRDPVSYTYVKGLSGLPTQRVPRNPAQQVVAPCSCLDMIARYR
ncbi:midnolin homolog [Venturia canescens]|uniref:midnolin homolog n=1 Tax=Venturia canescens TaxID=32260 RepID=UPI001C9BBFDE|nr:midnolin homolog [Venturia canescens]